MENKKEIELLAPARDYETGRVAILAGADAVYIGAPKFGARAAAGNDFEDIAKLCRFAHLFRTKVYLAINTIIFDDELEEAKRIIWQAYESGVDALIIQDMGILSLDLPPLPIFASTQTDNRDASRVKFLEDTGFSRVILARELSLEQIREIRGKTNIDLECFVHGALCVSYSGCCYLSQYLSDRSANRGLCIQACRLPYSLIDSTGREIIKEKYLLSLKDLNLSRHLEELIDAGISSFKIEGRLKDKAYVANSVLAYRQALDLIFSSRKEFCRPSFGISSSSVRPRLDKGFNRGFCEYFLSGQRGEWISPDTQKSMGEKIGEVSRLYGMSFSLSSKHSLKNGDGICFLGRDGQLYGAYVNKVDERGRIYTHKKLPIFASAVIYRNEDKDFEKAIVSGLERRIPISISVSFAGKDIEISALSPEGIGFSFLVDNNFVQAKKPEFAKDNLCRQMKKSGDSPFLVSKVDISWPEPVFIPIGEINGWRRRLLAGLEEKIMTNYVRPERNKGFSKINNFFGHLGYEFNAANRLAKSFYLERGAEAVDDALEISGDYKGKKLMTTKYCIKAYLEICPRQERKKQEISEPMFLISKENKKRLRLGFDCSACNMEIYEAD